MAERLRSILFRPRGAPLTLWMVFDGFLGLWILIIYPNDVIQILLAVGLLVGAVLYFIHGTAGVIVTSLPFIAGILLYLTSDPLSSLVGLVYLIGMWATHIEHRATLRRDQS